MSASDPLAAALRLLAVRDRSEAELADRLRRKGFAETQIAAVLSRCRQLGYLDDVRFARDRALLLQRTGRAVGRRLLADLQARGVPETTARAALAETTQALDERSLLAELRRRRFPDFVWQTADDRQRRRVTDYFRRRGFPLALVLAFFLEER